MNDNPVFSVLMPSYNHSKYIAAAIKSALDQSFSDLELIIIDDGSSDDSASIINSFAASDRRIRAYFHEQNLGIARTMNEVIARARGEYVALFASDDLWLKEKLQIQSEILNVDEELIVWSDGIIIDEDGQPTGKSFLEMHNALQKKKSGYIFDELVKGNYIFGGTLVVKRTNISELHYDKSLKYLNDHKIMIDLANRYEFHFISKPLGYYRIHGKNAIFAPGLDWQLDRIGLGKYILREYKDRITRKQRAHLYSMIGQNYTYIGDKSKAMKFIILAIASGFINKSILRDVVNIFIDRNSIAGKTIRKLY